MQAPQLYMRCSIVTGFLRHRSPATTTPVRNPEILPKAQYIQFPSYPVLSNLAMQATGGFHGETDGK